MQTDDIATIQEMLAQYFKCLRPIARAYPDTTSSIFELNSSAYGQYVFDLLNGNARPIAMPIPVLLKQFVVGSARLWARAVFLWIASYYVRGLQQLRADRQRTKFSEAVFIGHVAQKNGRFIAKDFTGFGEHYFEQQSTAILGQRLPHVSWRDYFTSSEFVPVEAHIHWLDVIAVWVAHTKLLLALVMRKLGVAIINEYVRDFASGRGPNSTLYARTAMRLVLKGDLGQRQIFLPLERHDWECLILYWVKQKSSLLRVFLVQNCTFSIHDCNMYVAADAPAYRCAAPDVCYVIDDSWRRRLTAMGIRTQFKEMSQHRFSQFEESITFDSTSKRILYLGSINPEKVSADFSILATLPREWEIDLRLHPSLAMIAVPQRFKRISDIVDAYAWCIHADTSMVVFLQAKEDRFIYLDHPHMLNQSPLPVRARQGKNCSPAQLLFHMEQR